VEFFRLPFSHGVWEIAKSTPEVEETLFTPFNEPPLYSFVRGKVIKRDPLLDGFFVETPSGELFLPSQHSKGLKVGSKALFQVVRESIENKPPLVSSKFFLPFCGCDLIFDSKGRVVFFEKKNLFEELKNFAQKWNLSLRVYNPKMCFENLPRLETFLNLLKENQFENLRWEGIFILLLKSCGGKVKTFKSELCQFKDRFEEIFNIPIECSILPLRQLLKELDIDSIARFLFSEKIPFEGGYLIVGEVGGITVMDVNGYSSKKEINRNALKTIRRYLQINRTGGTVVVDFAGLKKRENLKEFAKQLLTPLGCSVKGFTNGGLFEIVCPKKVPSVNFRLSEENKICQRRVKSSQLVAYQIGGLLSTKRGGKVKVVLNPLRKELEEYLKDLYWVNLEFSFDWGVPIDGYLLEF